MSSDLEDVEFLGQLTALLEKNEDNVGWIYPDSDGNPTVGIGHLLTSPQAAAALPFWLPNGTLAPPVMISAAWLYVKRRALPYKGMLLDEPSRRALLFKDLQLTEFTLQNTFRDLRDLPLNVRLALYDMTFNLGSLRGFPNLVAAVKSRDWKRAAQECLRYTKTTDGQIKALETRNTVTSALFLAPENFTAAAV